MNSLIPLRKLSTRLCSKARRLFDIAAFQAIGLNGE